MLRYLWVLLPLTLGAAFADEPVFQIGQEDGSYRELALGSTGYAGYTTAYSGDITVDAQAADAAAHFPYIQPSDHDGWAGARQHPVALRFALADAPRGSYRLTVALLAAHWGWPPVLVAELGAEQRFACLPAFDGDDRVLADPASAQPFTRELWFPATALRQGDNTLTLRTVSGSWLLYDAVKLDQVDGPPQPEAERIFRIGRHDHSYRELKLAEEGFPAFTTAIREPIVVEAQGPRPEQELPYILPGPGDAWAGGRTHPVELRFTLDKVPDSDGCLLVDLVAAHGTAPPDLRVEINGAGVEQPLPAGPGDKVLSDPSGGRQQIIAVPFPAGCFRQGENRIVLTALRGSWLLFDAVDLLLTGTRRPPLLANLRLAARPIRLRGTAAGEQPMRLSVSYWGPTTDAALELDLAGTHLTRPVPGLHFGANQIDLALPAAAQPVDAKAVLHAGALQAEATARLAPVRDLTLYVCPSIHTDIGYTSLQPECAQRHVDSLLNIMQVVHATSGYPEGARLKWNCEVTWEAEQLEQLAPDRAEEFFGLCRDERIGISAAYANILTGLCGHEQFCRLSYAAERLRRERGVRIRVATMTDNPSYVWSLPSVLSGSGVTYFAVGCNDSRGVFAGGNPMRPPVWWEGPDRQCALFWFGGGYGMASGLGLMDHLQAAEEHVPDFAAAQTSDMALVYGGVGDNQVVTSDMALRLADTVRAWNDKYESPKLVLATFDGFFTEYHRRHGAETPVVRGDGGAYWEDGAGSSAHETALNRETHELTGTVETLQSWAKVLGGQPAGGLWPVVRNSLLYDEHTWGAYNSITEPDSEFVKGQWAIKARFATDGHDDVTKALDAGLAGLAAQVAGRATDEVLVYNPLAWERSGVVTFWRGPKPVRVVDDQGKAVPQQLEPDIGMPLLTFYAERVPPLGYRVYRLEPALAELPMMWTPTGTGDQTLDAGGWRVVVSAAAGGVTSLRDPAGREWVDPSELRLGQAVYDRGSLDPWGANVEQRTLSTGRDALLTTGAVESRLRMSVELPGLEQAGLRLSWSPFTPEIGVTLLAHKPRWLQPETIFLAFPFAIPNARYRYELPLSVAEANADQLPNACRDWYAVQHFVDISNEERGVTVAFREAFLAEFGDIQTGRWLRELPQYNGALFANLMNNLWFTNYKLDQEGPVTFRFAILPHDGPYDRAKAIRFGFEQANPLLTAAIPAGQQGTLPPTGSFLTVSGPDTAILTVKQPEAGDGLIVRLYDVAGQAGERVLHLPRQVRRAARCNLVEVDEGELPVNGTEVRVPLEANGVATVRVEMP